MNNYNKKLTGHAVAVLAFCGLAQQVSAELYVSPVVRESVKIDDFSKKTSNKSVPVEEVVSAVTGQSTIHGSFLMREEAEEPASATMRFGNNVPLFLALEKVVPESKEWHIHIDDGLDNVSLSWKGGRTWEDVLQIIAKQNDLNIKVNHEEHAIGVSKSADLAVFLAKEHPEVWKVSPRLTLRQNLDAWCKLAGWDLAWDEDLKIDYVIVQDAVLTGKFVGEGGVVDRLLYSMRNVKKPLTAKFHTINKVLFVTEAGFRQEVMN